MTCCPAHAALLRQLFCRLTCKVEDFGEEGAAGGLALDAGLSHAGSLQHHVAILLIDALRTLSERLRHLQQCP